MTDFLEFLNQAESEALVKIPGISEALAAKITADRPFSTLDDCKRVKGLSEKKINALQSAYEKSLEVEKSESASVETEAEKAEPETVENIEEPKPVRRNVVGRVIAWLVVLVILAGAVYAGIRWGLPYINEKYIKPVENNTANISDLASQQSVEVKRLDGDIIALRDRVTELEKRADAVDASLKSHDKTLAQLDAMQKLLSQQMADQKTDMLAELDTQISLTRAIELLSRARLYLSENNNGLAEEDVRNCRDLLYTMLDKIPTDQVGAMKEVIGRLDMALQKLPNYPVVAVYDVDAAWQYLVDGLPKVPEQLTTPVVLPSTSTPTTETTVTATAAAPTETYQTTATP